MIIILENQNFIEGIFQDKKEIDDYLLIHPNKDLCKVIELPFDCYPFYILETTNDFIYCGNEEEVVNFSHKMKFENLENDSIAFNLYRITSPFKSKIVGKDSMGILDHDHISKEELEERKQTNNWSNHFGQFDNVMRIFSQMIKQEKVNEKTVVEIKNLMHLCKTLQYVPIHKIQGIFNIEDFTTKEDPIIELMEKDEDGEKQITFTDWKLPFNKRQSIDLTKNDWVIKME